MIKSLFISCALIFGLFSSECRAEEAQGRSITLPEGINIVLKDSRLLKVSLYDKDIALEDSFIARSALLPQVNASIMEGYLNNQPAAKFGALAANTAQKESLSFGFDVYQTLFDFGKSLFNYRAQAHLIDASKANIEAVKRVAVLEFVIAYFDVLEAEKMIQVAEKETESLTAYLSDIQHMYENGAAIQNDLLPAKVKLADAKQRLIAARNTRSVAAAKLNNILALPLREEVKVKDIDMNEPRIPGMEESWNTAQSQRPEIKLLGEQISASSLREKARFVQNYPVLFADGGYSYAENKYMVHQDELFLNLGAKADLFDGGASRALLSKERLIQRQLLEQKVKLIEDIKFEVQDSYLALKDAGEKVLVARDALTEAQENVRVNRVKYTDGVATSTDVLEAITMQTNAQTNFYKADYELKRNYAKLMYSAGIDLPLIYEKICKEPDGTK